MLSQIKKNGFFKCQLETDLTDQVPWIISEELGVFPVCYLNEHDHIVRKVQPLEKHLHEVSSYSNKEFPWHNEAPHRADAPHFLSLHCIQPGSKPNLNVLYLEMVEENLTKDVLEFLKSVEFPIVVGDSWGPTVQQIAHGRYHNARAVEYITIRKWPGVWAYNDANIRASNQEQAEVLQEVKKAIAKTQHYVFNLEAGDLLVLDNQRTLHSREHFSHEIPRLLHRTYYRRYL